ncbi:lipopolysaccharide biosynthesis protein [Halobaculum sp. EA56]|uniref:lipopolysaccharide biosynthesis protein n=1 Tax=Halobaculum sp. EA56 TaxID=3421648 RepID=UPI003EBA70D5
MGLLRRVYAWISSPSETLRGKVIQSGFWATLLNISDRALQIGKLLFLAQLLSPTAFGIVGLATLSIAIGQRITNLGLEPALINHTSSDIDALLDTTWSVRLVQTLVLVGGLVFSAPLVATFFQEPRVTPVLRLIAAGVLVEGLRNPSIVYFKKDLEFRKQFVYVLSGRLVDVALAVSVGLLYQNLWALVAGIVAGKTVRTIMSYVLHDNRPSVSFKREHFDQLFGFGRWIWATGVIVFIATTGDDTFVGWALGAGALGLYQMAFRLSNAPATEVTHVVSQVMFPTYSKLQEDTEALRNAFERTIQILFTIVVPLSVGIYLVTPDFIRVGLGTNWMPAIVPMQIMALAGLFRAISASGGAVFQGVGRPDLDFKMNFIRSFVIVVSIWPLTERLGITGAAVSITIGIGLTIPFWLYQTQRITRISRKKYIELFTIPLLASIAMVPVVRYISSPSVVEIVFSIAAGATVYTIVYFCLFGINEKYKST